MKNDMKKLAKMPKNSTKAYIEVILHYYALIEKELAEQGPNDRLKALRKASNTLLFGLEAQVTYEDMVAEYNAENGLPKEKLKFTKDDRKSLKNAAKERSRINKKWKKVKRQQKKNACDKKAKAD